MHACIYDHLHSSEYNNYVSAIGYNVHHYTIIIIISVRVTFHLMLMETESTMSLGLVNMAEVTWYSNCLDKTNMNYSCSTKY